MIPSRKIEFLVIHCSATREGLNVTAKQIADYHKNVNGWEAPGYSDVIELNGDLVNLRDWDNDEYIEQDEATNGAFGVNRIARHVCYVGGLASNGGVKDTRTPAQLDTLEVYVKYMVKRYPWIKIAGHRDMVKYDPRNLKGCPCFDVAKWCGQIGLKPENIF